jgi:hypothetical protein
MLTYLVFVGFMFISVGIGEGYIKLIGLHGALTGLWIVLTGIKLFKSG